MINKIKPGLGSKVKWEDPLSDGLALYLLMNEQTGNVVSDLSENGNVGFLEGGVTWLPERQGPALSFDGSNDTVRIANDGTLNFGANQSFSVVILLFMSVTGASHALVRSAILNDRYILERRNTNAIRWEFVSDGGDTNENVQSSVLGAGWFHVVATRDGVTGEIALYINGKADGTQTGPVTGSVIDTEDYYIGSRGATVDFFNGLVDHVMIYNRALSTDEISRLAREFYAIIKPTRGIWQIKSTVAGVLVAPDFASAAVDTLDPDVEKGSVTIVPSAVEARIIRGGIGIVLGSLLLDIAPEFAFAVAARNNPAVDIAGGVDVSVTPASPATARTATSFISTEVTFNSHGALFLYAAANWDNHEFFLEVEIKAVTGTARARLFDETANAEVTDSGLDTTEITFQRLRSPALALTNGNIYRLQFGNESTEVAQTLGGGLIAIAP